MDWDNEILRASNGDKEAKIRVMIRLRDWVSILAENYLPNSVDAEKATDKVMDDIEKWIDSGSPTFYPKPWLTARNRCRQRIIDQLRSQGIHLVPPSLSTHNALAGIDERFGGELAKAEDSGRGQNYLGLGWQILSSEWSKCKKCEGIGRLPDGSKCEKCNGYGNIKNPLPIPMRDKAYLNHPSIENLNYIIKCQWWWDYHQWKDYLRCIRPNLDPTIYDKAAREIVKRYRRRRQCYYEYLMAIMGEITAPAEKQVIQHLIWVNAPQKVIADQLVVSPSRIHNVKAKWMDDPERWGWDDIEIYKARLISLTHSLSQLLKGVLPNQFDLHSPRADIKLLAQLHSGFYYRVMNDTRTKSYFEELPYNDAIILFECAEPYYDRWFEYKRH